MKRFVEVWKLKGGVVDPPRPVDDATQYRLALSVEMADAQDAQTLQRRATRRFAFERDPAPTVQELPRLIARRAQW